MCAHHKRRKTKIPRHFGADMGDWVNGTLRNQHTCVLQCSFALCARARRACFISYGSESKKENAIIAIAFVGRVRGVIHSQYSHVEQAEQPSDGTMPIVQTICGIIIARSVV